MPSQERDAVINEFLQGIKDHVKTLEEKCLLARTCLREGIGITEADLAEMFHAAHTIKGAASLIGLEKIVSVSHHLGAMIRHRRENDIPMEKECVELFCEGLKVLKDLTAELREKGEETLDISNVVSKIDEFLKTSVSPVSDGQGGKGQGPAQKKIPSQTFEIDEKYLEVYLEDTEQNIEHFNGDLVALEKDPSNMELINNIFRVVHTIKGSSGMVNIPQVQSVAHAMENILSIVRDRKAVFPDMFSILFDGIDVINGLVGSLRRKEKMDADITPILHELKEYTDGIAPGGKRPQPAAPVSRGAGNLLDDAVMSVKTREILSEALRQKEQGIHQITLALGENTPMKSMKALVIEEHLKSQGTIIAMEPLSGTIDDTLKSHLEIHVLYATAVPEKKILSLLSIGEVNVAGIKRISPETIKELLGRKPLSSPSDPSGRSLTAHPPDVSSVQTPSIRIDAHKLDILMNLSGELVTVRAQFERLVNMLNDEIVGQRDFVRSMSHIKSVFGGLMRDFRETAAGDQDQDAKRVSKQLEQFEVYLSALDQHLNRSHMISDIHFLDETTGILGKIASDIQAAVMQARMVPIKGVFTRFNRIIRDISKDLGKEINLILEGEETELDKSLVDNLGEPLTHMIRNAVDHGIEDFSTRERLGKPAKGTILLKALHDGNNICIEVQDDGKGLDPSVLAQSALKKKLITQEQLNRLNDREKLDLMFLPGFSTAVQVTGLSGRGVGMDVVHNIVASLNGSIDIESEIGKGARFVLKIPLTLAIIQALLIVVDGEIFALPLESVTEIIKVTEEMIYSIDGNATVKLRDQVLSLIELKDIIHTRGTQREDRKAKRIVVISDGNSQVGIIVERLIGETEIVIKSLSHHFYHVKGVSGVTILGDGQISLILDPKLIIMESR